MRFAFLSEGKLYLKDEDKAPRELRSPFAEDVLNREQTHRTRNAWKGQGRDALGAGLVWGGQRLGDDTPLAAPIATQLSVGATSEEIVYTLQMSASAGIFRQNVISGDEQRVFHRRDFACGGLVCDPRDGTIIYAAQQKDGVAALEICGGDATARRALTDGDGRDQAPALDGRDRDVVWFQSAGIGRDGEGHIAAFGPVGVARLARNAQKLDYVLETDEHDHLSPSTDASGNLYFIRRPYRQSGHTPFWKQVIGVLLFPYHLCKAIFGFLDAFTRMFGKVSLRAAGGPEGARLDRPRMAAVQDRVLDLSKSLDRYAKGDDQASLVPADWRLIKRSPEGEETEIASNVAAYALDRAGGLLYTNGFKVWHRPADARQAVVVHRGLVIQSLAAL
jgi:hypothetical protein